jgi:hypothetical protein
MPKATTGGAGRKAVTFEYTGSVLEGVTISYDYGNVAVDQTFFQLILRTFHGRTVCGGFSETRPTPNGFGEWIRDSSVYNEQSLTPRHASRIAAILVAEGYATFFYDKKHLAYKGEQTW